MMPAKPAPAVADGHRAVYDGLIRVGDIKASERGWKASRLGRTIGEYGTEREAVRAVLDHHRAARAAH